MAWLAGRGPGTRGEGACREHTWMHCLFQETDYIMSYFDNGEDFGGDSDDNMDEAIY